MSGSTTIDLRDLRTAGTLMLVAAIALPVLPGPDGVPCPLRALAGIPCPLCGMTTSVIAAVHLDVGTAVAANPAGVVAVLVAVGLLMFRRRRTLTVPVWPLLAGLGLMWAWELARLGVR